MHWKFGAALAMGPALARAGGGECKITSNSYYGGDVNTLSKTKSISQSDCCDLCASLSECMHWTFHPAEKSESVCYLHDDSGTLTETHREFSTGTVTQRHFCDDEMGCSLAGECQNGKCVCDGWTHGDHCEVLNLLPVDVDRYGYRNSSGWNSWGGGTVKHGSKYYLFASQMHGKCPLSGAWSSQSEAVRLVSDHPMGPFEFDTVVIPKFAHNVKPYIAPDGTFLIYYVGQPNDVIKNCSAGLEVADAPLPKEAAGPVMVASSSTVDAAPAAWTHHGPMTDSFEWHSATNPTVIWEGSEKIAMWVSRRWDLGGGKATKNNWRMDAASWKGPYHNVTTSFDDALDVGEDPHAFKTKRGYHMLNHNSGPGSTKLVYSRDGLTWSKALVDAFNMTLHWTNGSTTEVCRRQRPYIVMAEDGMPGYLWNGVMDNPSGECDKDPTWTLAQQIGRPSSSSLFV